MYIIAGKHKKRRLVTPKGQETRPTSSQLRETVFNITQGQIEGIHFLDLFAGSGAMGFEALSRGASHVTFVENGRSAIVCIKKNIEALKEEIHTKVMGMDVLEALKRLYDQKEKFEMIYADPPYGMGFGEKVLDFLDTHRLLAEDGMVFIEDASFQEPSLTTLALKSQRKVGRATLYEYRFNPGNL